MVLISRAVNCTKVKSPESQNKIWPADFHKFDLANTHINFQTSDVALIELKVRNWPCRWPLWAICTLTPVKNVSDQIDWDARWYQAGRLSSWFHIPWQTKGCSSLAGSIRHENSCDNLIDMTGPLGGYWLVRLTAIAQDDPSDYLAVMKTYTTLTRRCRCCPAGVKRWTAVWRHHNLFRRS